ncbi:MAG: hypothetical protein J6D42_00100 [Clostridia bacterium]|nr:hypothetical protein [Clostridia bacterium]
MYKNLKIKLGEMNFFKDFINDDRGDMYPVLLKSEDCSEIVENNIYTVEQGSVKRLFCQFFPFATYELTADLSLGKVGFSFDLPDAKASISVENGKLAFADKNGEQSVCNLTFSSSECTFIVSCRPGAFDVYFKNNGKAEYCHTFYSEEFRESNKYSSFSDGYVSLKVSGKVAVKEVLSYIDNGVSIADIRPIKYENGDVIFEQGKACFTISIRMQEGTFNAVLSWIPGTAEFELTGAIFYDSGDGFWRGYVAPVILYNRQKDQWYVWVSSFAHEHILAYASFDGDPRFGVNVIDVKIMERAADSSDITAFAGIRGDEDPDLIYDKENDRWLLAVCRIDPKIGRYIYVFFESNDPFEGFRFIGRSHDGSETGGSFVRKDGGWYFVCGNDIDGRPNYRIYSKNGMQSASFNYPDGGFRGWGTLFPIKTGSRTRYFWLTFDRHRGSSYNWSYGNIYCFELGEKKN